MKKGYIDFHCDTITEMTGNETFEHNNRSVDLKGLKEAEVIVQCCSIFIPTGYFMPEERSEMIDKRFNEIYQRYECELNNNHEDLRKILSYEDVKKCLEDNKTGILLTIEDGGVLKGSLERLQEVYDKGVRLITLTWNHENELGYPNSSDNNIMSLGLKKKGFEVIECMKELGMIIDVSHLSDGGFSDVASYAKANDAIVIASHSNCRDLCSNQRNMTDDMIKQLAECGGVMGLNFASHFLDGSEVSRVNAMVDHVMHMRNVGGTDIMALGTDFDGIDSKLEIDGPTNMYLLYDALHKAGMTESELDKLWYKNALRVLKRL